MKRRIRKNAWGNWYGYLGNKKVEWFASDAEYSQEEIAQHWLKTGIILRGLGSLPHSTLQSVQATLAETHDPNPNQHH